jgi:hypothetical protein
MKREENVPKRSRGIEGRIGSRIWLALVGLSMVLAACEDQGNPGDDNILTGASLVVILVIGVIIGALVLRGRRQ